MIHKRAIVDQFTYHVSGDQVHGYAAPGAGPLPCSVVLKAEDETVQVVNAVRFSQDAAGKNVRHGWCGYTLTGIGEAFALSNQVSLHCYASGRHLASIPLGSLDMEAAGRPLRTVSVTEMLEHLRQEGTAASIEEILPFVEADFRNSDARRFITDSYFMILKRPPNFSADKWAFEIVKKGSPRALLDSLLSSEEYRGLSHRYVPGPFHDGFRYSLAALN